MVATVGLIVEGRQAEAILQAGEAGIIAIGREFQDDPNWAHHAQAEIEGEKFEAWPRESGWWLDKRAGLLRKLYESGETPMDRYLAAK